MKVNEIIQVHKGYNSIGGMYIYEEIIEGKVVKVNKKSIRVHLTHVKRTTNGQVTQEKDMDEMATFTFWKTIERQSRTVDIYKNSKYGIIEVVH